MVTFLKKLNFIQKFGGLPKLVCHCRDNYYKQNMQMVIESCKNKLMELIELCGYSLEGCNLKAI